MLVSSLNAIDTVSNFSHRNSVQLTKGSRAGHDQDVLRLQKKSRDAEQQKWLAENKARGERRETVRRTRTSMGSSQAAMKSTVNGNADDVRNTEDVFTPEKNGHIVRAEQPKRRKVEQGSSKAQPILEHVNEVEASSMAIETRPTSHEKVDSQTKNDTKKKPLNKESLARNSHTPNHGDDAVKPVTNNNRGPGLEKARLEMIERAETRRRAKLNARITASSTSPASAAIRLSIVNPDATPVTVDPVLAGPVVVNVEEKPKRVTFSRTLAKSNALQTQRVGKPHPRRRKTRWELVRDMKAQKYALKNPDLSKQVPALFQGKSGTLRASRPGSEAVYWVRWETSLGSMKMTLTKDTITSYCQPSDIAEGTFQVRLANVRNQEGDQVTLDFMIQHENLKDMMRVLAVLRDWENDL